MRNIAVIKMCIARLLIVSSTVVGNCSGLMCPEGCWCEDSPPYIANCSSSGLTDIPESFPNQSTLIDLSFNRITYLKENLLGKSNTVNLSKIILANNFIASIKSKTFYYEAKLTEVDLSNNKIIMINSRIFKHNMLLVKLSFRGNKKLHLTHFGGFLQSDSLRELDMSHCNIGIVPNNTFVLLPNIQHIDLSHNNITTLEPQSFAGLGSLNYLDISNNGLSSIVVDVFKSVLHLDQQTLKIEGQRNKRNATSSEVRLANNPWMCDCEMKEVYEWCRSVDYNPGLICLRPENLKYKPWEKLDEIDDCTVKDEDKLELLHPRDDTVVRSENYEENVSDEHKILQSASLVEILIIVALAVSTLTSIILMWMMYNDGRAGRNSILFHTSPTEGNNIETHELTSV